MPGGSGTLPWLDLREDDGFTGVEALDDHTLRIRVDGKYPQFKYWLAMTFTAPIPWEADRFYSQPGMAAHDLSLNTWPVGTGPYMLTAWDITSEITIEANPDYWGEPAGFDRIIFRNVADSSTQLQLLETGEADMAFAADPDKMQQILDNPGLQLLEGPSLAYEYVAMHTSEEVGGPLAKKEARQAVAHAIDYQGIIDGLMGGRAVRPATERAEVARAGLARLTVDVGNRVVEVAGAGAAAAEREHLDPVAHRDVLADGSGDRVAVHYPRARAGVHHRRQPDRAVAQQRPHLLDQRGADPLDVDHAIGTAGGGRQVQVDLIRPALPPDPPGDVPCRGDPRLMTRLVVDQADHLAQVLAEQAKRTGTQQVALALLAAGGEPVGDPVEQCVEPAGVGGVDPTGQPTGGRIVLKNPGAHVARRP